MLKLHTKKTSLHIQGIFILVYALLKCKINIPKNRRGRAALHGPVCFSQPVRQSMSFS